MPQTARFANEDSARDEEQPQSRYPRPQKGKQSGAVRTPIRPSRISPRSQFRSASSTLSTPSSSAASSLFDSSSPLATPLTPPSSTKALKHQGTTDLEKLLAQTKIGTPKDDYFGSSPPVSSTPENTASRSSGLENLEEDAQPRRHDPVDSLSSALHFVDLAESPSRQKQERRQKRKGGKCTEPPAPQGSERNSAASRHQIFVDVPMGGVSPQPGPSHQTSLKNIDSDTDMPDADEYDSSEHDSSEHDSSEALQLPAKIQRKYVGKVAKDALASTTKAITPSDNSGQDDSASISSLESELTRPMTRKVSKEPAKSLTQDQSETRVRPKSSSNRQSGEGDGPSSARQAVSSSKLRARKSTKPTKGNGPSPLPQAASSSVQRRRVSSPSIAPFRRVEVLPADAVVEPQASPTTRPSSDQEERDEEHAAAMAGELDPSIEDEDVESPDPETTVAAQVDLGVQTPTLERHHLSDKDENELKVEIHEILYHEAQTDLVSKHFIAALLHPLLPYFDSEHPLLKYHVGNGYIYMFTLKEYPGYVKIGVTDSHPDRRRDEWGAKCKIKCVYTKDPNNKRFSNNRIVERLIHAELYNKRRDFRCKECNVRHSLHPDLATKRHVEWFQISEDEAREVVEKWRSWVITHQPFTPLGTLRDFWRFRLEAVNNGPAAVDSLHVIDWTMKAGYVWHCFKRGFKIFAPLLVAALLAPNYTRIPISIFFRFGLGAIGWGVCFLTALAFISFIYHFG